MQKLIPVARMLIEEAAVLVALGLFISTVALWAAILGGWR